MEGQVAKAELETAQYIQENCTYIPCPLEAPADQLRPPCPPPVSDRRPLSLLQQKTRDQSAGGHCLRLSQVLNELEILLLDIHDVEYGILKFIFCTLFLTIFIISRRMLPFSTSSISTLKAASRGDWGSKMKGRVCALWQNCYFYGFYSSADRVTFSRFIYTLKKNH